jgi:hypothetical protein
MAKMTINGVKYHATILRKTITEVNPWDNTYQKIILMLLEDKRLIEYTIVYEYDPYEGVGFERGTKLTEIANLGGLI